MENLFVVILRYISDLDMVDMARPAHVMFLEKQYALGTFIASGVQTPKTGGVIIARAIDRATLQAALHEDPFFIQNLAEYTIYEFTPTRYNSLFKAFLETLEN